MKMTNSEQIIKLLKTAYISPKGKSIIMSAHEKFNEKQAQKTIIFLKDNQMKRKTAAGVWVCGAGGVKR